MRLEELIISLCGFAIYIILQNGAMVRDRRNKYEVLKPYWFTCVLNTSNFL